ncbi:chondroitinase-B domain-containing protein [uncultured Dokdonia sp.]|uniref:chondroitinase-B domain-containing protein n=1 Tax=uncultured Dokdonia sp. TaxID=575653 RepID=UPI002620FF73|nr:chondroitinase-B domain-containing protein [uncultured Dokdonia sp.]
MYKHLILLCSLVLLSACKEAALDASQTVATIDELNTAIKNAEPGDHIVLKNGVWTDAAIKFYGEGTEANPISLTAETPGEVILEGNSSLKLGGSYLQVSGLHFKNGFTTEKAVIRYKIDDSRIAYHSTVTDCVIEDFTNPDRDSKNHWIELWGQHNSFDHNYITGKTNQGPTLRVMLKGNENVNTYHQIKDNHFGPRPRKGGPRAETLQLGDSYTSMTPGYVNVEHNYFERCNGEVEIISSKSNYNTFKNNVFFESEGSLVLRHGNYATIDGNVFIGNDNSEFIGGIRVINTGHWIVNNYFYNLKGNEFRAPLAVMNGIPKSPLNRYNQVTDVVVAHNSFINSKTPWHFGVGANLSQAEVLPASEIRSARAERMVVANNLIYTDAPTASVVKTYDSITGVTFKSNFINVKNTSDYKTDGIITKSLDLSQGDNLFSAPQGAQNELYNGFDFDRIDQDLLGNSRDESNRAGAIVSVSSNHKELLDISNYGTSWFNTRPAQNDPETITVSTEAELAKAIKNASQGTTINIAPGTYEVDGNYAFAKAVTLQSTATTNRPVITFKNATKGFELQPRAKLKLSNIILKGDKGTDAFATLEKGMGQAYELWLDNVEIDGFKSVLETSKASFADTISIKNSTIKNTARGIQLNKETNDKGDYNAAFVFVEDNNFTNVGMNVLDYYRGGYDESTIGGSLVVRGNTFTQCGAQEKSNILLKTRGIVNVTLAENTFTNNPIKTIAVLWGEKGQEPVDNKISNSGEIKVVQNLKLKLVY